MFRIPAAQVFADLVIGISPEAAEVAGQLNGPVIGPKDLQEQGDPTARNPGGILPAKQFLKTHRQCRRFAFLILDGNSVPAGHNLELGRLFLDQPVNLMSEVSRDIRGKRLLLELFQGCRTSHQFAYESG